MFIQAFIIISSLLSTAATAADYRPYENGRFGYSIDVPLGFKTVLTPENGDGVGLESADGKAKLSI